MWLFISLSFLKVEQGSNPKRVIIREGIIRSEEELAHALAYDTGFDLKGAYARGFTSRDVVDYLVKQPHEYSFAFYDNRFYEGRITVLYIIPLSVCLLLIVLGTAIIIKKSKSK